MSKLHRFCSAVFIVFLICFLQGCVRGCKSGEDKKLKEVEEQIRKNNLKDASKILYEIIKNNPQSDRAYEMRIELSSQLKKDRDMLDDYEKIVEIKRKRAMTKVARSGDR